MRISEVSLYREKSHLVEGAGSMMDYSERMHIICVHHNIINTRSNEHHRPYTTILILHLNQYVIHPWLADSS